jgi:hypothetical protein
MPLYLGLIVMAIPTYTKGKGGLMKYWQRISVSCGMVLAAVSTTGAAEYETQANKPVRQAV